MSSATGLANFVEFQLQLQLTSKRPSLTLAMSDKLKDAVLAEANSARAASGEILKSGAYLYPFKVNYSTPPCKMDLTESNPGNLLLHSTQRSLETVYLPCWTNY